MNATRNRCYRYLINEDWRILEEKGIIRHFKPGETILREGCAADALLIIRKGVVRLEVDHRGAPMELDRVEGGEFIGVMSFLDDSPMRVSAVSEEEVELLHLDLITMNVLLASIPGFASRFYLTVAVILSERLRTTIGQVPTTDTERI